jgi:serine/threonine protein kinase
MNAEALLGRSVSGCLLQQVAGSGTMGVVYRARQTQPARDVAVKMLTRAASLELPYQIEFLESFRSIAAQVATLHHPHIVSIYEYGDADGLGYLVMAYVQGQTLEEALSRRGALPLEQAALYLDQIARALDFAHVRGIAHRDLKPANIFISPDESIRIADFYLTKLLTEGGIAQMRLSHPGMLDYMSPELVVGKEVGGRADIYSLGALLYRMVTGEPPFQGQTLMKVATKHLKMPPPSPRALRPELPPSAERAILKALAKNPEDRYESALDFAMMFRQALKNAVTSSTSSKLATASPKPQLDASLPRLTGHVRASQAVNRDGAVRSTTITPSPESTAAPMRAVASTAIPAEAAQEDTSNTTGSLPLRRRILLSESARHPVIATDPRIPLDEATDVHTDEMHTGPRGSIFVKVSEPITPAATPDEPAALSQESEERAIPPRLLQNAPVTHKLTQTLPGITLQESADGSGTWKLDGPAKIVSIPVAGQPGQFVTGILPAQPFTHPLRESQDAQNPPVYMMSITQMAMRWRKRAVLLAVVLLVVLGSLSFWFAHNIEHPTGQANKGAGVAGKPDLAASATAQAMATLDANTILYDPLSTNIRDWPVMNSGTILYQFANGAYNIINNDPSRIAPAILEGEDLDKPYAYSLTMEEIHGDDTSINNEFGMIVRFNSQLKNGKQVVTFYSFEVLNKPGGEYQFWKYDNSAGSSSSPWDELAKHAFGSEFHEGHGLKSINTIKIVVNGSNFTLFVNGKQVWKVSDKSLTDGSVGMLVNLKGTQVAFSNLRLTNN